MKFNWKHIGPNQITELISPWVYRIKLPHQLFIHDVQPISWLENAAHAPLPYEKQRQPPQYIVDREEEYKVEMVDNGRQF
jgi:hypothetical protein